jgi:hypothetical protein
MSLECISLDNLPVLRKTNDHVRNLMVFCYAVLLLSHIHNALGIVDGLFRTPLVLNANTVECIKKILERLNRTSTERDMIDFINSDEENILRTLEDEDLFPRIDLNENSGVCVDISRFSGDLGFIIFLEDYLYGSHCANIEYRGKFVEKAKDVLESLIDFIQGKKIFLLRGFEIRYNSEIVNKDELYANGVVKEYRVQHKDPRYLINLQGAGIHILKNFFEHKEIETEIQNDEDQLYNDEMIINTTGSCEEQIETEVENDEDQLRNTEIIISATGHDVYEEEKHSYLIFIIPFILFLIITTLSNIFAWAKIVAITATMTKIIISGIGSVVGAGCLVAAIALSCKNKICSNCYKHSCVKKISQQDELNHSSSQHEEQYI